MCEKYSKTRTCPSQAKNIPTCQKSALGVSQFLQTILDIYTIKTQLKYVYLSIYMCIYMFICSELIEETGRRPGLIFGMSGYFWHGSESSSLGKIFTHLTEL